MPNKRVFYAVKTVAIGPEGATSITATNNSSPSPASTTTYQVVHGLQSCGINTNFNLEQVFELGQLAIYENIENIPDVEISLEKVLDGYAPMYLLATMGSTGSDLAGRSTRKCQFLMSIFSDDQKFASGTPVAALLCSGVYPQSVSYSFPVEGNQTESLTLIGNHKLWYSTVTNTPLQGAIWGPSEDSPAAIGASGGVGRRENVVFAPNTLAAFYGATTDANGIPITDKVTVLPTQIPGISVSGLNLKSGDEYNCHVQSIEVSTNLGRDTLFELGRRVPYHRFVTFPTEVTCAITVMGTGGDNISATEDGGQNNAGAGSNLKNETIRIRTMNGLFIDLGIKNKINSITYGGADAGGGNDTVTYNFTNFNDLDVKHTSDPTALLRCSALSSNQFTNTFV